MCLRQIVTHALSEHLEKTGNNKQEGKDIHGLSPQEHSLSGYQSTGAPMFLLMASLNFKNWKRKQHIFETPSLKKVHSSIVWGLQWTGLALAGVAVYITSPKVYTLISRACEC